MNSGTRDAIHRDSIFSNGPPGIDLAPPGVNPNHSTCSAKGLPNLGQNYPVISAASSSGGNTTITGTFNCTPNTKGYTLEFFRSASCDPSGFGEGQTFLGSASINTDANGNAAFKVTFATAVPAGSFITATATDPSGNSSEFSACRRSS